MAPAKRKTAEPSKADTLAQTDESIRAAVSAACRQQDASAAIDGILQTHIAGSGFSGASIRALERWQYFEQCLWPLFTSSAQPSAPLVLSVLVMLNAKRQQHVLHRALRDMDQAAAERLVSSAMALLLDQALPCSPMAACVGPVDGASVRSVCVYFLDACFESLEVAGVRAACLRLTGVGLWTHVAGRRLVEAEYERTPGLQRLAKQAARRTRVGKHADERVAQANRRDQDFLWTMVCDFIAILWCPMAEEEEEKDEAACAYACTFLAFLVTLTSQLATRRFVALMLRDAHVVELCGRAPWAHSEEGVRAQRFCALRELLRERLGFAVDDVSGHPLDAEECQGRLSERVAGLQAAVFARWPEALDGLVLDSGARLADPAVLAGHLAGLSVDALRQLASAVGVRTCLAWPPDSAWAGASAARVSVLAEGGGDMAYAREFLLLVFCQHFAGPQMGRGGLADERVLLAGGLAEADERVRGAKRAAPGFAEYAAEPLALPRMGLQYLSLADYLQRSLRLVRVDALHAVHEDMADAVRRLMPREDDGSVVFDGWARMALPLCGALHVTEVQAPRVGEQAPRRVRAELAVDLNTYSASVRGEWDADVRPGDALFLLAVRADGVAAVRVCTVEAWVDRGASEGGLRRLRVLLDPAEYHEDEGGYGMVNVVLRRRPQEAGVRGVLDALRGLAEAPPRLPAWLAPTFLGYGDPAAATALHVLGPKLNSPREPVAVDLGDTFVSAEHVRRSFASTHAAVEFAEAPGMPGMVEFGPGGRLRVLPRKAVARGPVGLRATRANAVEFTPMQVRALVSAALPGLTLIVGPPGTGKTDVAVQAVANLYHGQPRETTLLLAHSNQALNQLFAKIAAKGCIEPRHLLRLGHGEGELLEEEGGAGRYSSAGRIESFLQRRGELLGRAQELAASLGVAGDFGHACGAAEVLFAAHVRVRWEGFRRRHLDAGPAEAADLAAAFPFTAFFDGLLGRPLFAPDGLQSAEHVAELAAGCFGYLEDMFGELRELQAFELLPGARSRADYLLTQQARVVAMTCTHAAMHLGEFERLGFRYDNVVVEEAAQMLDVETLVPLCLQGSGGGAQRRLKRLILIGDHNQLPPVVRHAAVREWGGLDQSFFQRMVRLGVPYVELDRQARARPEIADLYRMHYDGLGDLDTAVRGAPYGRPNAGMAFAFQFVDVGDFHGVGQSEPSRHFYQNLGEAEFLVQMFRYLRLVGHPAESIALLTAYNGQRALVNDVLERRCFSGPHAGFFGRPRAVATVDQYQGQQADIVLLSLVRTREVGYLRDLRRLTVGLSRARLGLYVFGRRSLFEACWELREPFARLLGNGDCLTLCPEERFGVPVPEERCVREVRDVEQMAVLVDEMVRARGTPMVLPPQDAREEAADQDAVMEAD